MKYIMKKTLAIIMMVIMVLNMIPLAAFADDTGTTPDSGSEPVKVTLRGARGSSSPAHLKLTGINTLSTYKINSSESWDYYVLVYNENTAYAYGKLDGAGDIILLNDQYSQINEITNYPKLKIVRVTPTTSSYSLQTLSSQGNNYTLNNSGTIDKGLKFSWTAQLNDGKYVVNITVERPSVSYYNTDGEVPLVFPDDGYTYYFVGGKNEGPSWYALSAVNGNIRTLTTYKSISNQSSVTDPAFEIYTIIRTKLSESDLISKINSNWYNPDGFEKIDNSVLGGFTYTQEGQSLSYKAVKNPTYTSAITYYEANGITEITSPSIPSGYYIVAKSGNSWYYTAIASDGSLSWMDASGTAVTGFPAIQEIKIVNPSDNTFNCIKDSVSLDGTDAYTITLTTTADDQNIYQFRAVKKPAYEVEIRTSDEQEASGIGSDYTVYAGIDSLNNSERLVRYYYSVVVSMDGTSTQVIPFTSFNRNNDTPNTKAYSDADESNIIIALVKNLQVEANGDSRGNISNGTIIEEGNLMGSYTVSIDNATDGKTIFTLTKNEPYKFNLKSSAGGNVVFDDAFAGYWYLLSTLTKSDGEQYYYVKQVANNSNTINQLSDQEIEKYYITEALSDISIDSPAGNSSVYQSGDSVENVLVYTGTNSASNYKEIVQKFDDSTKTHIVYGGGNVVNKFMLSDSTSAGVGNIVLTSLPVFKLKTVFKDATGSEVITGNIPNDYKLLIKMQAKGNDYYALQGVDATNNPSSASGPIAFYLYTPAQNGQSGSVGTVPYYYSGEETLTTQVVTGAGIVLDAIEKGISDGVVKYNENTVDADKQNSDLTRDLFSTSSSVTKVNNENIMATTFTQRKNNGVNHEIEVRFFKTRVSYPGADNELVTSADLDTADGAYYFVVRLYNAGKLVAYKVKKAENVSDANSSGKFVTMIANNETFTIVDDKGIDIPNSSNIKYDPSVYTSKVRLYKTNTDSNNSPVSLDDITLATVANYGSDIMPGYDFLYNKDWTIEENPDISTTTWTKLGLYTAQKKIYKIHILVDDGTELHDDDALQIFAEAKHQTSNIDKYDLADILTKATKSTTSDGKTVYEIIIEDQTGEQTVQNWTQLGQTGNKITGNETFKLYVTQKGNSLGNGMPISLKNGKSAEGEKVNYNVTYDTDTIDEDGIFVEKNVSTEGGITTITHYVHINPVTYEEAIDPYDVLGEGAEFGVIADTYERYDHTETNFAVKKYIENTAAGIDLAANISTDAEGMPFYVGEYNKIHFTSNTTVNPDIYTPISRQTASYIHNKQNIDESSDHIHQDSANYDVTVVPTTKTEINKYVNKLINKLTSSSQIYSTKSMISPTGNEVDTTAFPDGITIYVDAAGLNWTNLVKIKKLENQSIVFNIPGDNINIKGASSDVVTIYEKDDQGNLTKKISMGTNTAGNGGGENNDNVENYILNHIVYNAYEATRLTFTDGPAGLFLAPNANVEEINGSGTGWVATGRKFKQTGAEWHFFRTQRHYKRENIEAGFKASKFMKQVNLDSSISLVEPNETQQFSFAMEHLNWETGNWDRIGEVKQNNKSLINFGEIGYTLNDEGEHYYRIYELSPETLNQYERDNKKYYVKVTVSANITGTRQKGDVTTGITSVTQLNGYEIQEPVYAYYVYDPETNSNTEANLIIEQYQTIHETETLTVSGSQVVEPYSTTKTVSRKTIDTSLLAIAKDTFTNSNATTNSDSADTIVFVNAEIQTGLTISKELVGESTGSFTFTVATGSAATNDLTYYSDNGTPSTTEQTITLNYSSTNNIKEITGLLPGTYTVTETGTGDTYKVEAKNTASGDYSVTDHTSIAINGTDVTVYFKNTKKGSLVIKKHLVGETASDTDKKTFEYTVTSGSGADLRYYDLTGKAYTGETKITLTLPDDETNGKTVQNLLPNTYKVTEVGTDLTATYKVEVKKTGDTSATEQMYTTVTLNGDSSTVDFTNTKYGKIEVDKTVFVNGAASTDAVMDGTYYFTLFKGTTKKETKQITVTNGVCTPAKVEFTNLLPDTYTVKETDSTGDTVYSTDGVVVKVYADGQTATQATVATSKDVVVSGDRHAVHFINDKTYLGFLKVEKALVGLTSGTFVFTVQKEGKWYAQDGTASTSEVELTLNWNSTNNSLTVSNLEPGTYTVTEKTTGTTATVTTVDLVEVKNTEAGSYASGTSTTGEVASGQTVSVYFRNTKLSVIRVTKAFSGLTSLPDNFQIVATYTVEGTEHKKLLTLGTNSEIKHTGTGTSSNPYTWTITGLPVGTEVSFEESGIQVEGYSLKVNGTETTKDSATVTAKASGTSVATGAMVNEYEQIVGDLEVTKSVSVASPAEPNKAFKFTVTLSDKGINGTYGDMTFTSGVATFSLKDLERKKATNLPAGITYTVEEEKYNGYTTISSDATGTIVTGTTTAAFVNTYDASGSFTVDGVKTIVNRPFIDGDALAVSIIGDGKLPDPVSITVEIPTGEYTAGFNFSPIEYKLADLDGEKKKTFTYTVTESPNMAKTTAETIEDKFTVDVSDNGDGTLKVEPHYTKNGHVTFINTYNASAEIKFAGKKTLEGREFNALDKLVVKILEEETGTVKAELTIDKFKEGTTEQKFVIDKPIQYSVDEIGGAGKTKTFSYIAQETATMDNVVTTVGQHKIEVQVSDNYSGVLNIDRVLIDGKPVTYDKALDAFPGVDFVNTVPEGDLSVEKKLEGEGTDPDRAFEVTVTLGDKTISGTYGDMTFKEGVAVLSIKGGEKKTAKGLPANISYTVEETEEILYELVSSNNLNGTIDQGQEKAAHLVNKYVKPDQPTFEKKIQDINDSTEDKYSGWQDSADHDIGDSVPFKLTAVLAKDVTKYWQYHVTFHDTMDPGLTFEKIESVTVNGEALKPEGYTFTKISDQKFDLTVTFNDGKSQITREDLNGGKVEVIYYATLNENAVLGNKGNVNKAYLEYSCSPELEDDGQGGKKPSDKTDKTKEDFVICFTYEVDVNKVDPDGAALKGAEFTLEKKLKNGTTKQIACVTDTSGAKFTFTGLDDGVYVLTETKVPEGFFGIEPVTFEVKAGHETLWTDLEKRNDVLTSLTGEVKTGEIKFTVDKSAGMLTADVENAADTVCAMVKKVWKDDEDRDGLRPLTLTLELLADGEKTGKTVTLNESGNWIGTLDGLRRMKDGKEVVYSWAEPEVDGYKLTGNVTSGRLTTLTNTHETEKTGMDVKKVWVDSGKHPAEITVQLYADGKAAGVAVKLNEANGWKYSWSGLDKNVRKDGKSQEIRYTVAEMGIPDGYEAKITGSATAGYVITNTLLTGKLVIEKTFDIRKPEEEPEEEEITTEIEVVKIWEDNDDKDGNRPESITVHLFAGGEEIRKATLTAAGGWRKTFGDLPKFVDGHPIHYSVTEDPVEWYVSEIRGFTIRNKYVPKTVSLTVKKVWDDENNKDGFRPESIAMKLNNGTVVMLSEENGWTATVTNLPTKVNGQPAVYYWTEQTVTGYVQESVDTNGTVTVFTNKPWERPEQPPEGKRPRTAGDTWFVFEEYETPLGVEVMINHVGDCFD